MSVLRLPCCYIIYILLTHPSPPRVTVNYQIPALFSYEKEEEEEKKKSKWHSGNSSHSIICFFFLCALLLNTAVCLLSLSFHADLNPAFLK